MSERIENIISKITHTRVEVRKRGAANLLQKFQNKLIEQNKFYINESFFQQLMTFLDLSTKETIDESDVSIVLSVISMVSRELISEEVKTKIIEKLYYVSTLPNLSLSISDKIKKTIDYVGSIESDLKMTSSTFESIDNQLNRPIDNTRTISSNITSSLPNDMHTGAGAILFSKLVHTGWKFTIIKLTSDDEKYLFDLEVRLKLQQSRIFNQLFECLENFPSPIFLQRPGLLFNLLNILNFNNIDNEDGFSQNINNVLNILLLLHEKLNKVAGFLQDGSLCSWISEEKKEIGEILSNLKYPSVFNFEIPIDFTSSVFPIPSYSGFSFMCIAAILPLISAKDLSILRKVQELLFKSSRYCLEPNISEDPSIDKINIERLQHILNRLDQLIVMIKCEINVPEFWSQLNSNHPDESLISDSTYSIAFFQIFINFMVQFSSSLIKFSSILKFGENIRSLFEFLLLNDQNVMSFLPEYQESLSNILRVISPETLKEIDNFIQLENSYRSFQFNISSSIFDHNNFQRIVVDLERCILLLNQNYSGYLENEEKLIPLEFIPILFVFPNLSTDQLQSLKYLILNILSFALPTYQQTFFKYIQEFATNPSTYLAKFQDGDDFHHQCLNLFVDNFEINFWAIFQSKDIIELIIFQSLNFEDFCDDRRFVLEKIIININKEREGEGYLLYKSLYHWLKVLSWNYSIDSLSYLLQTIQDNLTIVDDDIEISHSSVFISSLELFHTDPQIRQKSCDFLQKLFNIKGGITTKAFDPTSISSKYSQLEAWDNFQSKAFTKVKISENTRMKSLKKSFKPNSAIFTSSDLNKLVSLSFGDLDFSLKSSSLKQLIDILIDDEELFNSFPDSWYFDLANNLISSIQILLFDKKRNIKQISEIKLIKRNCFDFCFHCISLLHFLENSMQTLTSLISLSPYERNKIDFSVFLKLYLFNVEFTTDEIDITLKIFLEKIQIYSGWLIEKYLLNSVNWALHLESNSEIVQYYMPNCDNTNQEGKYLGIPNYLTKIFGKLSYKPKIENIDSMEIIFYGLKNKISLNDLINRFHICSSEFKAKEIYRLPSIDKISSISFGSKIPDASSFNIAIVTWLFESLVHSQNHQSLNSALTIGEGLISMIKELNVMFVMLKISLITAVSNILLSIPKSKKDKIAFLRVLRFLNIHLSNLLETFQDGNFRNEIYETITIAIEGIYPTLLETITIMKQKIKSQFVIFDEDMIYKYQVEYFNFFEIISQFKIFPDENLVSLDTILFSLKSGESIKYIYDIFLSDDDNYFRVKAGKFIENLINWHNGSQVLMVMKSNGIKQIENNHFIFELIKVIKRGNFYEGSYKDYGVNLVLCKIFYQFWLKESYSNYFTADNFPTLADPILWHWLLRLFYESRNEMNFLSMEIFSLILPQSFKHRNQELSSVQEGTWPFAQQLYFILIDENNSSLLRAKSFYLLLQIVFRYSESVIGLEISWGKVLESVSKLLENENLMTSLSSINMILDSLNFVGDIKESNPSDQIEEIFNLAKYQKMFQLLFQYLNPRKLREISSENSLRRINVLPLNKNCVVIVKSYQIKCCKLLLQCIHHDKNIIIDSLKFSNLLAYILDIFPTLFVTFDRQDYVLGVSLLSVLNEIIKNKLLDIQVLQERFDFVDLIINSIRIIYSHPLNYVSLGKILNLFFNELFCLLASFKYNSSKENIEIIWDISLELLQLRKFMYLQFQDDVQLGNSIDFILGVYFSYYFTVRNRFIQFVFESDNFDFFFSCYFEPLFELEFELKNFEKKVESGSENGKSKIQASLTTLKSKNNTLQTNKWREKTRSYSKNESNSNVSTVNRFEIPVHLKPRIWSILFVLKSTTSLLLMELPIDIRDDFIKCMCILLKYFSMFSLQSLQAINSTENGQISSLLWSCFANTVFENTSLKTLFFNFFSDRKDFIVNKDNGNTKMGLLNYFVSNGLNNGYISSFRQLNLNLCNGLLRSKEIIINPSVRISVSQTLSATIQQTLKMNQINSEVITWIYYYYFSLISFISNESLVSCFTHLGKNNTNEYSISFSDLVVWMIEKYCLKYIHVEEIKSAAQSLQSLLLVSLGLVVTDTSFQHNSYFNSILASEKIIKYLSSLVKDEDDFIRAYSKISLKSISDSSEKAKGFLRLANFEDSLI